MKTNNISFNGIKIHESVMNMNPKSLDKIQVVTNVAANNPHIDFTISSNQDGDMQVKITRANPLDMLIATGFVKVNSKDYNLIMAVEAMQNAYKEIHGIKEKDYQETIPEADVIDDDQMEFILEDMIDILNETIDPPETN